MTLDEYREWLEDEIKKAWKDKGEAKGLGWVDYHNRAVYLEEALRKLDEVKGE